MKKLFLSWLLLLPLISRSAGAQLSLFDFIAQQEKEKIPTRDPKILEDLKKLTPLTSMTPAERDNLRNLLKRAVTYYPYRGAIGRMYPMENADHWVLIASSMENIIDSSNYCACCSDIRNCYIYTERPHNNAGNAFLYFPTLEEAEAFYGGPGTHHLQKIMDEMTKLYDSNEYNYYEKIGNRTIEEWLNALSLPELPESQQ